MYLSISAFARAVGKSHTWISKLTNTTLKPYTQQVGNRTMIDTEALKLFEMPAEQENTGTESNSMVQELQAKIETLRREVAENETVCKRLETDNNSLKDQLNSKERENEHLMQIRDTLTQQLSEKDTQISSLHQLLDQQQRLQLQTQLPAKTSWWSRFFSRKSNV